MGPVVRARKVNFWFGEGDLRKQILFDVSFDIDPGEVVLLTGQSGSGKTTLLTLVGALRTLTSGSVGIPDRADRTEQSPGSGTEGRKARLREGQSARLEGHEREGQLD
jgi:ABC-type lipoprotein export system ATPase subunit